MRTWKKVLVGAMSVATIGAGANVAATATSERSSRHDAQTGQVSSREAEPRDDRGVREAELRGRVAEQEQEREAEQRRDQNDARGRERERERERERQQGRESHDGQNRGSGGGHND